MESRVQRWGHSLAIRIPRSFTTDTHLAENTKVDITLEDGRLIITPVCHPQWTLDELLDGITADNIHREHETGPAIGHEEW